MKAKGAQLGERHDVVPVKNRADHRGTSGEQSGSRTLHDLAQVPAAECAYATRRETDYASQNEPERYELFAALPYRFHFNRREFFQVLGSGIAILLLTRDQLDAQESGHNARRFGPPTPREIGAWLHIGEDGAVTVYTGKVEVGQNIRTSLAQAVAEELRVPISSIRLTMGDTALTPFDMGTFGSRTTPTMAPQLRKVAAVARDTLIDLAAKTWNIDPAHIQAADGKITDRDNRRSLTYGQLARGQALARTVAENDPLTPTDQWRVSGKSVPKVDGVEFVTGRHRYTADLIVPGMLYGKVLRPPSFGASLSSVDLRAAQAIAGVIAVRDGDFAGVAAPTESGAARALQAIRAEWKTVAQPSGSDLFRYLKTHTEQDRDGEGGSQYNAGSVPDALARADHRLEQTYTFAYIAHAPLEPRAALAEWKNGALTVSTGTQRPFGVRSELAAAFHMPEERVRVLVPDTGAAYGGKHSGEAAVEAARLAQAAGKPVKLVWTREEEFTWAYFRPAGFIEIRSGVRRDGTLTAWEFHNYNSGAAGIRIPYEVANQRIEFHFSKAPLRQGSYRALAATANHFARESHLDDVARAVKMDPLELRYRNLKDPRLKAVFEAASRQFRWDQRKRSPERGFGIAGGVEKGGYVATCAEVAIERSRGTVHVVRVVTAFECGAIVNPDHLKNQIEGANVMGLGGALFESIQFDNGRVLNPHFSQYRVPRFSDAPQIEVVLLDRRDLPSAGAGETPIVGIAPAVGNAIFDATGTRLRSLPMVPQGLKT